MKPVVLVSVVMAAFGVGRYSKSTYSSGPTKEPSISSSDAGVRAEGMRVNNPNEDADVGTLAMGLLEKSSDVNFWQRRLAIFHSASLPQPNAIAKPAKTELKLFGVGFNIED